LGFDDDDDDVESDDEDDDGVDKDDDDYDYEDYEDNDDDEEDDVVDDDDAAVDDYALCTYSLIQIVFKHITISSKVCTAVSSRMYFLTYHTKCRVTMRECQLNNIFTHYSSMCKSLHDTDAAIS
uniref:Replicase polyprotein 1a n=1 Tax=Schistocephalus solidus TaxID=70667 RepID=A0A183TU50_SCHSO